MSKYQNPFSELFSSFANQNPFADNPLAKSFDFDKSAEQARKNAKAFNEAAKAVGEGVQSISRLQSEIIQKNVEGFSNFFKNISSSNSAEETVKKNAEFAKSSFENAVKNTNEILDIANKSNKEASEIIGRVVTDSIDQTAQTVSNVSANKAPNSSKKKAA